MDSSLEKLVYLADEDDAEETFLLYMNEFLAIQIHNNLSSKSKGTHEPLYSTLDEKYNAIAYDFSPKLEFLLASRLHNVVPVYFMDTFEEKSKVFELLKINVNLFTYDTSLGMIFDEFKRLSSIYKGLEDGDLKGEALKEKATLEGLWGHENKKGKKFCSWLKESFGNYDELDYELILKLKEYWWGKKEDDASSEEA
nr:hypothetical protein [Tanacetum cinerariifolium]